MRWAAHVRRVHVVLWNPSCTWLTLRASLRSRRTRSHHVGHTLHCRSPPTCRRWHGYSVMRWDALRIAWSLGALPSIFCDSHGKSGTSIVFHLATFVDELLRASMVHATTAFAIAAAQNTCLETLWHKYKQSKHVRTKMGVVGLRHSFSNVLPRSTSSSTRISCICSPYCVHQFHQ
jgi:hypothetical protein